MTRVINLLGARLSNGLMPALTDNNEAGFWESSAVYRLNEDLLESAGSRWDDWRRFNTDWFRSPVVGEFEARALEVLNEDLGQATFFALKDPRICRLVPFWKNVLHAFGAQVKCVLPIRQPLEVAASLQSRDGFSLPKSTMLWLRHVLDAEAATRELPRAFVTYDELLGDWRASARKLSDSLEIAWPRFSARSEVEIDRFLENRHRHHRVPEEQLAEHPELADWVHATYGALLQLCHAEDTPRPTERLERVRADFDRACSNLGPLVREEELHREVAENEASTSASTITQQAAELQALQTARDELQAELREKNKLLAKGREHTRYVESLLSAQRQELVETKQGRRQLARSLSVIESSTLWRLSRGSTFSLLKTGLLAFPKLLWWLATWQIPERLRLVRTARMLTESKLFDPIWYLEKNPDVALAGASPINHWLTKGWKEGRDPGPLFSTSWYLEQSPDLASSRRKLNLLFHYLDAGAKEGRDPNPLFDSDWYLKQNPDVAKSGTNPLIHYLRWGAREGRDPHLLFDTDWYLAENPDVAAGDINPLAHYLHAGGAEQRNPSPLFDARRYLENNPDVASSRENPLLHFLKAPATRQRDLGPNAALRIPTRDFQPSERFALRPGEFLPSVTVVVPNFNHQPYLRQRLDSIYGQTYSNYRVVLLDDCSTDASRQILEEYAREYPEKTKLVFNAENSGGPFHQWRKAIESADSELIWIAESDDYCDGNFLEALVPFFMDEAVALAYAHSVFVDRQGVPSTFRFEGYLSDLSADNWSSNYVTTAHREVARYLGRKNTIPNVSSAVFRRCKVPELLRNAEWLQMQICGDWLFYLHVVRGGKIAYSIDTNNYFRFHSANSSAKTYSTETYYREHEAVAREIARLYDVPDETLQEHRQFVERFFEKNAKELQARGVTFSSIYDSDKIYRARAERLPNVMMVVFGFATGGGEVFPIRLANELRRRGYGVNVFNFLGEPVNANVRSMLDHDIPVVEKGYWFPGVAETIEDFGVELIHTHHASADKFFGEAIKRGTIPVKQVVTTHGMYEMMSAEVLDATLEAIGDTVSTWVYIADKNLPPFRRSDVYVPDKFIKVPNGMVVPEIEAPARSTIGIDESAFVLCLASRAIPEKGWREAVRVTCEVRRRSDLDVHLLLLGDGPLYEEMKREDVPEFVHLLGFVNDVVNYFALADVGFLPTTFEGESFPLTVVECLMAGRPMIASDVGEVSRMLRSDTGEIAGFLIDVSDGKIPVQDTARQVVELAENPAIYSAKAALAEKLTSRFRMDHIVDEYAAVYGRTLREHKLERAPALPMN